MIPARKAVDPVEYPETDDMGEHFIQRLIMELLRPLVERWLRLLGRKAFTGADQFWYFEEGDPAARRAPDVYVVLGVPQDIPPPGVWKTWEGHRPDFVLEVVGRDWKKDYAEAPRDYDAMGAREVVVFDPWATPRSRKRVRWQVFRRARGRGLACVVRSLGDRVRSEVLGCFLRAVEVGEGPVLRVATGAAGDELLPTDEETAAVERAGRAIAEAQAAAERAARQGAEELARVERAEREAADAARQAAETERRAAEAEVARLRAELEALRRGR